MSVGWMADKQASVAPSQKVFGEFSNWRAATQPLLPAGKWKFSQPLSWRINNSMESVFCVDCTRKGYAGFVSR